ncbi:hypothetical protein FACS1894182_12250 [Bacteroidia bacterium]|nr:hypothetical protein FACS1894182_12250 [Bacteroidia bacterium]
MFEFGSPVKNRIRNSSYVYTRDSFIYAVSDNMPVIERYDLQGNYIDSYDYSDVKEVKSRLSYAKQNPPDIENSYYQIIANSYLHGDKLYLLLLTEIEYKDGESNKILEIDLNGTMKATRLFHLGKRWFGGFCVTDYLWAFDRKTATIVKYKMP